MATAAVRFCYDWTQGNNNGSRFCSVPFYMSGQTIITSKQVLSDALTKLRIDEAIVTTGFNKAIEWSCLAPVDAVEIMKFLPDDLELHQLNNGETIIGVPTFVTTNTGSHFWVFLTTNIASDDSIVGIIQMK